MILADSVWRRRFNSDLSIIGRRIVPGGASYMVVGVLPPAFEFPKQPDDFGSRIGGPMEMFRPLGTSPKTSRLITAT